MTIYQPEVLGLVYLNLENAVESQKSTQHLDVPDKNQKHALYQLGIFGVFDFIMHINLSRICFALKCVLQVLNGDN